MTQQAKAKKPPELQALSWTTTTRKILDLIPYPTNPRQMTTKQVDDLTASLQKFNLAEIPAINSNNTILAGHQRLKVMALLGRGDEEIDVRIPSRQLTAEEEREYLVRSNKNTGEWDWDILANDFDIAQLTEWGFQEYEFMPPGLDGTNDPDAEWKDMPEYDGESTAVQTIIVHFKQQQDVDLFASIAGQNITEKTKSIWYPKT